MDETNFNAAVDRYADTVYRIAYQNMQNAADAEDITQDVFVKCLEHRDFNDEQHLKAWLIRVTINRCRDAHKSFWRRYKTTLTDDITAIDAECQHVFDELAKLPPKQRNVLYLHCYEGYTIAEIAKILHANANTVGSWLNRAKKCLRQQLTEGGYVND